MKIYFKVFLLLLFIFVCAFASVCWLYDVMKALVICWGKDIEFYKNVYHHFYLVRVFALPLIVFAAIIGLGITGLRVLLNYLPYHQSKKGYLTVTALVAVYVIIFIVLVISETSYRSRGFVPGYEYSKNVIDFTLVDTLKVEQRHLCDDRGMNFENPTFKWWWDSNQHINQQGFLANFDYTRQSIDSLRKLKKKIIFIIGDSFVEGVTDQPFDYQKTFIELLKRREPDCAICAFGVAGTDPINYELITEKFVPELKPDMVIVAFCGTNDMLLFDRHITPGIPLYWQTNAGWMQSVVPENIIGKENVVLRSPEEAYRFYKNEVTLQGRPTLAAGFCRRICLSTNLYFKLRRFAHKFASSTYAHKLPFQQQLTYNRLHEMDSICAGNNVIMDIAFIPDVEFVTKVTDYDAYLNKYGGIFKDMVPRTFFPLNLKREDYINNNIHFTKSGNSRFAEFLDSIISKSIL
ncbi:MAG: hypothetical protein JWO06_2080 [Bacteroidota bacterium]|nr:hypothetical protein [Bacteroidota bacterium]